MLTCTFCDQDLSSICEFLLHLKCHRNIPNFSFQCGIQGCTGSFSKFQVLKAHIYRVHRSDHKSASDAKFQYFDTALVCQINSCSVTCTHLTELFTHLKSHIQDGTEIACPFRGCDKKYSVQSSFSAHLSRKHKNCSIKHIVESIHEIPSDSLSEFVDNLSDNDFREEDEDLTECVTLAAKIEESSYLNSLALFYLKLQAKLLIPASTIQTIIEEYQIVHELGQSHLFSQISDKLQTFGISEKNISELLSELKKNMTC